MIVNREYLGETPIGMTFSTLAGSVGGGQQTPGFFGCGKVFLTSRKFLFTEGGFGRIVWMPKELKELLHDDLVKRFNENGLDGLLDKIADETIASSADDLRAFMEKVNHPALKMRDMADYAQSDAEPAEPVTSSELRVTSSEESPVVTVPLEEAGHEKEEGTSVDISALTASITEQVRDSLTKEIITSIIDVLSEKFLGQAPTPKSADAPPKVEIVPEKPRIPASDRISKITSFALPVEKGQGMVSTIKLGNLSSEGGTRGRTYTIGGENCMPFHLWEGQMPHRPLVAMEVFDTVSEKYPEVLRGIYGDLLMDPVEMARVCVEEYGADLISVKLDGIHPEKGNRTAAQSVELVKAVLKAVDVPLIITGTTHFEKSNEVMKAIAQACEGENLLFNWVEQDNYRTIAGAAMAYGHSVVAQAPIDVNISKQLNILLTNMGLPHNKIVIDPMTSAIGYGVEYTYSVMERIRSTGLGGDNMLLSPMIVSVGQECARIKEFKATEQAFPEWGDLTKRSAYWEAATATSLLYAGADILIIYTPGVVLALKKTITELMDRPDSKGGAK